MPEPLTDRLDHFAGCLDQEGRDLEAALVREAVGALSKPKVVGTPWTTPLKGDKCVRADGKSREALSVTYRRGWGSSVEVVHEPRPDHYPERVHFMDGKGRQDTVSASSWATWCRAACKGGGTYERAPETV